MSPARRRPQSQAATTLRPLRRNPSCPTAAGCRSGCCSTPAGQACGAKSTTRFARYERCLEVVAEGLAVKGEAQQLVAAEVVKVRERKDHLSGRGQRGLQGAAPVLVTLTTNFDSLGPPAGTREKCCNCPWPVPAGEFSKSASDTNLPVTVSGYACACCTASGGVFGPTGAASVAGRHEKPDKAARAGSSRKFIADRKFISPSGNQWGRLPRGLAPACLSPVPVPAVPRQSGTGTGKSAGASPHWSGV